MKKLILIVTIGVAGCANAPTHELTYVSNNAPIWNANPDKWNSNDNTLTTPPMPKRGTASVP